MSKEWLSRAQRYCLDGHIGLAIQHLEQAVAQGEECPEICKELARLSLAINEVRAFSNWCHEAIRLSPADAEPHLMIGRFLSASARWTEALESLREASRLEFAGAAMRSETESLLRNAEREYAAWARNRGNSNLG